MKIEATVYDIGMMRPDGSIGVLMHAQKNDDSAVRGVKVGSPATLIVDEPAMTWISVNKSLPDEDVKVLVTDGNEYEIAHRDLWEAVWMNDYEPVSFDPTHYMYLIAPAPVKPKQAAQDVLGA